MEKHSLTKLKIQQIATIIILCVLSDNTVNVSAYICKVRAERYECKLKWVLEYPNPCKCNSVVMGGFNRWIPERSYEPVAVDRPLISDDINAIRNHYELKCVNEICSDYLGMENGDIPDGNINASGYFGWGVPSNGRLNGDSLWGNYGDEDKPWIEADIGYQTYVSGVITQGDGQPDDSTPDWVTSLKVSTFKVSNSDEEVFVKDNNGEVKIFEANTDRYTAVMSTFPAPVFARIVRITCLTRNQEGSNWNMRFEVVGCKRKEEEEE